ncbi:phage tail tube protein [Methylobacterium organophilum]|uniref:phage tail tube protein n=1 Tax=Methylobacterium organophilum TaxID=410 RepID=UPI001F1397AC|nr:phage tail tube protein [Methylobacterium organophilum]UMY16662.1 phage tail tube protein [Methylobacterium organophilum]
MARARGSNAIMAGAFETTYGTPPTTGYRKLPFVQSNLGDEQGLIASDLLGYGREPLPPSRDVVNNEGDVVVPIDLRNFGNWLKLFMGAPASTANAGTSTHVFTSGAASLPSMTVEVGLPEVPSYGQNFGIRGNTMRVQMQRSGLLTATLGLIAQGENKLAASGAGTPAESAVERFSPFQGAITRGGVALGSVVSAEFTYSNNLDKVEVIRGDGRIEDADPGMVGMTGSIAVRFANTTLLDQATAGTPVELTFGWVTDASRSLIFKAHSVYLPRAKTPVTGPTGVQATFNWQAARDNALGKTVTATLINDVPSY